MCEVPSLPGLARFSPSTRHCHAGLSHSVPAALEKWPTGQRSHRRRIASQAFRNHHHAKRPTDRISGAPEPSPSREAAELENPARKCRVAFPSRARVPTGTAPVRASFLLRTSWALSAQPPRLGLTTYIQTGVPRVWPVLPVWRGRPRPRRIEGIAPAMSSRSLNSLVLPRQRRSWLAGLPQSRGTCCFQIQDTRCPSSHSSAWIVMDRRANSQSRLPGLATAARPGAPSIFVFYSPSRFIVVPIFRFCSNITALPHHHSSFHDGSDNWISHRRIHHLADPRSFAPIG